MTGPQAMGEYNAVYYPCVFLLADLLAVAFTRSVLMIKFQVAFAEECKE